MRHPFDTNECGKSWWRELWAEGPADRENGSVTGGRTCGLTWQIGISPPESQLNPHGRSGWNSVLEVLQYLWGL